MTAAKNKVFIALKFYLVGVIKVWWWGFFQVVGIRNFSDRESPVYNACIRDKVTLFSVMLAPT